MLKQRLLVALLGLFLLAGCGADPDVVWPTARPAGPPRPLIIDTDMGADDWVAILYLLQRPDVDVLAITVAGTGETHCKPGVRNALGLLELAHYRAIPVACGSETPLGLQHQFPAAWRAAADNMMGLQLPPRSADPAPAAPELLTATAASAATKVNILALGPLTNLAVALQQSPSFAARIESLYVMGGAIDVPGNVGSSGVGIANKTAEWNFYADPQAAALVLAADLPLTLVPLDATNHVPVTTRFFERLAADHRSLEAGFVYGMIDANRDYFLSGAYWFWDSFSAALLVDNSLAGFKTFGLRVVTAENEDSGRSIVAADGHKVAVALAADASRFEQELLATLNRDD